MGLSIASQLQLKRIAALQLLLLSVLALLLPHHHYHPLSLLALLSLTSLSAPVTWKWSCKCLKPQLTWSPPSVPQTKACCDSWAPFPSTSGIQRLTFGQGQTFRRETFGKMEKNYKQNLALSSTINFLT